MSNLLSPIEHAFCRHYHKTGNAAESWRAANNISDEEADSKKDSLNGNNLLRKTYIQEQLLRFKKTTLELASEETRELLLDPTIKDRLSPKERVDIFKAAAQSKDKEAVRRGYESWAYHLCNSNASVFIPPEHISSADNN